MTTEKTFKNSDAQGKRLPTVGEILATATHHEPDERGHWGDFGGRFVPEALMAVIEEITDAWAKARSDQGYLDQLD